MSKIQDFRDKRNLFSFWSLPINPWASFATWPHLEAPLENIEKINKYQLSNIELVLTHIVSKLVVFGIVRMLLVPSITLSKKFKKNLKLIAQELRKIQSTIIWLIGTSRVNKWGLDFEKCVGFDFDGCNIIIGQFNRSFF